MLDKQTKYICPMCGLNNISLTFIKAGYIIQDEKGEFKTFKKFYSKKDIQKLDFAEGIFKKQVALNIDCLRLHCRTCQYSWALPTVQNTI